MTAFDPLEEGGEEREGAEFAPPPPWAEVNSMR
jgi:hypothetical protein